MISILLPVYNADRYLRKALDSLLNQTYQDFEIIAVDDGSVDQSLRILREYATRDDRIRVISRANTGIVGALNDGLEACARKFIARMDADDWAHPKRLEIQLKFLRGKESVVACGTHVHMTDEKGRFVKRCPRPTDHTTISRDLFAGDGGAVIHPTLLARASALKEVGGYREEALWIEDLDLYLRLTKVGELANVPQYLLHYRQHRNSVNVTKSDQLRMIRKNQVLSEAHERIGSRWIPIESWEWPNRQEQFRDWAISSLEYGRFTVSVEYAIKSVLSEPWNRTAWKTLKYVLTAGRAISEGMPKDTSSDLQELS